MDENETKEMEKNRKIYGYILVDNLGQIVYQYDVNDWRIALIETLTAKRKLYRQNIIIETIPVNHDDNQMIKEEIEHPFDKSNSFKFHPNFDTLNNIC